MTHRAEQIMAAVHAAVTGLATTGAAAYRAREESVEIDKAPAVAVWQSDEEILSELSHDQQIVGLNINIDAVSALIGDGVVTELNQIRAEVTAALAGNYTLGLAFVHGIAEVKTEDPDKSVQGDRPVATMRMRWLATYRRSRTDPAN